METFSDLVIAAFLIVSFFAIGKLGRELSKERMNSLEQNIQSFERLWKMADTNAELRKENQQLKKDLHDLHKQTAFHHYHFYNEKAREEKTEETAEEQTEEGQF